jgi:biopolymer transport protein ExbD
MPSVKIPRKSTFVDMTPFVDVAFLILTFFIMATKFKPEEPVEIKTPNSVSVKDLNEIDAIQVMFDSTGRIFFSVISEKDPKIKYNVIEHMNKTRNLNLTEAEMTNFVKAPAIGVPFSGLKQLLAVPAEEHKNFKQPGIPLDTLGGELYYWIRDAVSTFSGKKLNYLIKGDNEAKYPAFKQVLNAFKKNDIFKFQMITMLEDTPPGSELEVIRNRERAAGGN